MSSLMQTKELKPCCISFDFTEPMLWLSHSMGNFLCYGTRITNYLDLVLDSTTISEVTVKKLHSLTKSFLVIFYKFYFK